MYLDDYFTAVQATLDSIRTSQRGAICRAGNAVASSLAAQGGWFIFDTGHLLQHEAFIRAGGLLALTPFTFQAETGPGLPHRAPPSDADALADIEARSMALALDRNGLREGDVLLINSNSGRTMNVIEAGLQCRGRGIITIGVGSLAQIAHCPALHPSGLKLPDVADIMIDAGGPVGDATVPVAGNEAMCPVSGMAAAFILWAIQAEAVQRLQERGIQPTIYRSVHLGGEAFVKEQQERYRLRGM